MKIKIDASGVLHVERAGKMKRQDCPFETGGASCGDWCALFGEPEDHWEDGDNGMCLELCRRTLYFQKPNFTDERKPD